jgi:hypothetical protein
LGISQQEMQLFTQQGVAAIFIPDDPLPGSVFTPLIRPPPSNGALQLLSAADGATEGPRRPPAKGAPTLGISKCSLFEGLDLFGPFALAHVDRRRIQGVLDVRGIELLDHLHACTAVFGHLVDVRAFYQPHADVGVGRL